MRGDFDEVSALLRREIRIDPTFADFVRSCRQRDVPVTVVSSGVDRIISDRLAEIGVHDIAIIANSVIADPAGWRLVFRDDVPNGTDKAALVRQAREAGSRTIFIGDGRSDYDAAVVADLRFVKRGGKLEDFLGERHIAFIPFATFAEVTERFEAL